MVTAGGLSMMVFEPLEVSSPLLEVTVVSSRGFFAILDMMEWLAQYNSPMDCGVVNYCVLCRCRLMKKVVGIEL